MRLIKVNCLCAALIVFVLAPAFITQASIITAISHVNRFHASFRAFVQASPPGSYKQTCSDIKVKGNRLSANCRAKNSSIKSAVLDDFQLCTGDVWNNDGDLGCNKAKAVSTPKADLRITSASALNVSTISFAVISHNQTTPANKISLMVSAKNADDSQAWFYMTPLAQTLPANDATIVTLKLPSGKDLYNKTFSLVIDAKNEVDESNEQNNATPFYEGTAQGVFPSTLVDLYPATDLYFLGNKVGVPNSSTKKIRKGMTGSVAMSEAEKCTDGICTFYFAAFVARSSATDKMMPFNQMRGESGGKLLSNISNSVVLQPGQTSALLVLPVKLKAGENKLSVEVDPYNKIAEGNEGNNLFVVTITVQPF